MSEFHHVLSRQIKKHLGEKDAVNTCGANFLEAVSDAYTHADEDRARAERSLDLSSKEMAEVNGKLEEEIKRVKEQADELERLNTVMIGRELRVIDLKKEVNILLHKDKYHVE